MENKPPDGENYSSRVQSRESKIHLSVQSCILLHGLNPVEILSNLPLCVGLQVSNPLKSE